MHAIAIALVLAGSTPSPTPSPAPALSTESRHRIDELVQNTMAHQHLPGLSIAIAQRGAILYARGYGYRDVAGKQPAGADTVYNIASNSKQFTAAAIMLLQQDGKVKLDERLAHFLPEFRHGAAVTVQQLLTHTSGLPDYADLSDLPHVSTAKQFVDLVSDKPLDFQPGTRFEYSNTNYVILGMIVEQSSGMPFGTFLSHRIFEPLRMTSASTRVLPESLPHGAFGYTYINGRYVAAKQTPDDLGYGDGTVNASVLDLVKWDAALDSGAVVDAASWALMTHAPLSGGYGSRNGYGFGLDLSTLYGHREVSHEGLNVGFGSVNATFPDEGWEIIALSNGDAFQEDLFVKRIVALLASPSADQFAAEMTSSPGEDTAVTSALKSLLTQMQTGRVDAGSVTKELAAQLTPVKARQICVNAGVMGAPDRVVYRGSQNRYGANIYSYEAFYPHAVATIDIAFGPHQKIAFVDVARED